MVRARVIETDHGIQGDFEVGIYDQMQRRNPMGLQVGATR
jgi:hypothetical protein